MLLLGPTRSPEVKGKLVLFCAFRPIFYLITPHTFITLLQVLILMCMNFLLDLMCLLDAHKGNIGFERNRGQIFVKHMCYVPVP